jgi:Thymidylate synthase complementing protein
MILTELRMLIPSFVRRVDMADRGGVWIDYLKNITASMNNLPDVEPFQDFMKSRVDLVDWDPDGEMKVIAAALFEFGECSTEAAEARVSGMTPEQRKAIMEAYTGDRTNRRHRPGRAFERTYYKFDCISDYGAFRDLQRHRILTVEWQNLNTRLGYNIPHELSAEARSLWIEGMDKAAALHKDLADAYGFQVAQYCIPFAYNIRYSFQLNARSAMHMIELRTQQQGHPSYRSICSEMLKLISQKARHNLIADAFQFADLTDSGLGRLEAEKRAEARSQAIGRA